MHLFSLFSVCNQNTSVKICQIISFLFIKSSSGYSFRSVKTNPLTEPSKILHNPVVHFALWNSSPSALGPHPLLSGHFGSLTFRVSLKLPWESVLTVSSGWNVFLQMLDYWVSCVFPNCMCSSPTPTPNLRI